LKRVLILFHESQRRKRPHYLIDALSEVWRKQGIHVAVAFGVRERLEADLLIPQVDLTHTPDEYIAYIRSFPAAVNRDVTDISKRKISAFLLHGGEDYDGPVIVKTDNNCGGIPEHRLARRRHPLLAQARRKAVPVAECLLRRPFAWRSVSRRYPIYNSLADVPACVFRNRALVVERFLPETDGTRYFMRHYLFLGDHTRSVRVAGPTPTLKRAECTLIDEGLPVPEEVLSMRRTLGLDYGKIDYTVQAGRVAVLDVNRTPSGPGTPEATARTTGDLADGIWSLLPDK